MLIRLFTHLDGQAALPPGIIMHSYGGSAGMIESFTTMKSGIGSRFYFSFSSVINMRSPKTVEVIKKVPQVLPQPAVGAVLNPFISSRTGKAFD